MINQLVTGFLAGLSTGVYCLGVCLPIFVPLLMADKQNLKSSFRIILEFSLGRLSGYLLFGGLIGFFGKVIEYQLIHQLAALAMGLTGALLVFYAFGFLKLGHKACKLFFGKFKVPIILGFLTGINICPPFLASLTYVFNLRNVINSLLYFVSFFIGTSCFIVPAGFLGLFSEDSLLQKIARISGIFVGLYFIVRSLMILFNY